MAVAAISSLFLWLLPIPVWQPIGQHGIVGNVVTGEMSFRDFTIIDVEKGFEVVITQADSYTVRLTHY